MRRSRTRAGFTLIELIASMVVLAAVASLTAPLVFTLTGATRDATDRRSALRRAHHAMERTTRLLREAPEAAGGGVGIATAETARVALDSGASVVLSGETLTITDAGGISAPLCEGVETFALAYLASDGMSDASGAPTTTHSVRVLLEVAGVTLDTVVFPRAARQEG